MIAYTINMVEYNSAGPNHTKQHFTVCVTTVGIFAQTLINLNI